MTTPQLLSHLYSLRCRIWIEDGKVRLNAPEGVLTETLRHEIKLQRDAIHEWLVTQRLPGRPPIKRGARPAEIPLSYAQTRLWFLNEMEGVSGTYNIPEALRLRGPLDVRAMQAALADVVAKHEALRTMIQSRGGVPFQTILLPKEAKIELPVETVTESVLAERLAVCAAAGFQLSEEIPFRARLFYLDTNTYVLLLVMHHIAGDGWSMGPLLRDIAKAYESHCLWVAPDLGELPIQYVDFALWQRAWLGSAQDPGSVLSRQLRFWHAALDGIPEDHGLRMDRPRTMTPSHSGRVVPLQLRPELHVRLAELARQHGATMFMVLQAALAGALREAGAGEDVVIGSPVAGRTDPEFEELVGVFVNTLVLRADVSGQPSFIELLKRVRTFSLDAFEHQDVPFERIVETLEIERSLARHPIFQIMLVLQNAPASAVALPGMEVSAEPVMNRVAKFDLGFSLTEQFDREGRPAGLYGGLEYSLDLFDAATAERFARIFVGFIERAVEQPEATLSFVDSRERRLVTETFNAAELVPCSTTLVELFERQVRRTPDVEAIVHETSTCTYSQLNARANRLARVLLRRGAGKEGFVGIYLQRSIEMVVALWAVLKSGAAYVPLDPTYPEIRIAQFLQDAQPAVVVSTHDLGLRLPQGTQLFALDEPESARELADADGADLLERDRGFAMVPEQLAYIIYTSGSTGLPKGVAIPHASAVALAQWASGVFTAEEWSGVLAGTSICFDLSIFELIVALLHGGTAILAASALELASLPARDRVRLVNTVPSVARALVDTASFPPGAATIVLAGEALPASLVRDLHRSTPLRKVYNLYGPSEDTTYSSGQLALDDESGDPTIGPPFPGTQIYVLDRWLEPVAIGVTADIYIAGAGLARGYLYRPGLTAERFVANPFGTSTGDRIYRTGDRGCWREDGTLEFVGRADNQVKIRGFRVELGEIEAVLSGQPDVRQVAVVVLEGKQLVAYVVMEDGNRFDESALRRRLAQRLPEYMVPQVCVEMRKLPLTLNGKLDRKALPAPARTAAVSRGAGTLAENVLCTLVAELLHVDSVNPEDNFFRLGGDSIVSIQLVSRARQAGLLLTPRDVFRHQTMEALAEASAEIQQSAAKETYGDEDFEGELMATPVMLWMMERGAMDQFCQCASVGVPAGMTLPRMLDALQALLDAHSSLRLQAIGGSRLKIRTKSEVRASSCLVRVPDPVSSPVAASMAKGARLRLRPLEGRIFEALWFDSEADSTLFLAIHHLAVDGVSWRILLSDLQAAWSGQPVAPEETPFRTWANSRTAESESVELMEELPFWQATLASGAEIAQSRKLDAALDTYGSAGHLRTILGSDITSALLTEIPAAFHANVQDVLLAAFAMAGGDKMLVNMEGHGRGGAETAFDLSRTVGWFTTLYPVFLDVAGLDAVAAVKRIKEAIRSVPGQGTGYGLLRYLRSETRPVLAAYEGASYGFNYLGRMESAGATETVEADGAFPAEMALAYVLEVNALTLDTPQGPMLSANWTWALRHLGQDEVEAFVERWKRSLAELAAVVRSGATGRTPSDFPLVTITQQQIDGLRETYPDMEDVLPLTPLQEGLLFHSLYDRTAPDLYTVQFVLAMEGELDAERMGRTVEALLQRHANLRGAIGLDRLLIVRAGTHVCWREGHAADEAELQKFLEEDRGTHFDLMQSLLRFTLLSLGPTSHRLVLTNHHILLDGWSMPLLLTELMDLYAGDAPLPKAIPYRDYLEWLQGCKRDEAREGWRTYLADFDEPMLLAHGSVAAASPKRWETLLSEELTARINETARRCGVTVNTILQGVWALLLRRLTGRDDILFGITVSGRPAEIAGIERMAGLFINTLPLGVDIRPSEPLAAFWSRLQRRQSERLDQQYLGLAEIQRAAGLGELFDTLLVFENYPMDTRGAMRGADGLRVTGLTGHDATHYPLTLIAAPFRSMYLRLDYDPVRVGDGERIAQRFLRLLEAAVESPSAPTFRLDALVAEEQLLVEAMPARARETVPTALERFHQQVRSFPEACAVEWRGENITYSELNRQANRIAHFLLERGAGPETLVGVRMERSPALLAALLGSWKTGAAYLPLDPRAPSARTEMMVDDASPVWVLDEASVQQAAACSDCDPMNSVGPGDDQAAYVLYTSGTTGKPKGVVVAHRQLASYIDWAADLYGARCGSGAPVNTPLVFDATVTSLFVPLLSGKPVLLLDESREMEDLAELLASGRELTLVKLTPAHLEALRLMLGSRAGQVRARVFVVGGEALRMEVALFWKRMVPGLALVNEYGPTEATVGCCTFSLTDTNTQGDVPIGVASPRAALYVLDSALEPVLPGVTGELWIGGDGVARGYLGRPVLTAERFVADPFSPEPGARMYRTGDLAHRNQNGVLEFLGRADDQIKLRGFRMEPGEIEAVLRTDASVAQALVLVRDQQLLAYVVQVPGSVWDETTLRDMLATRLPEHMVPSAILRVEHFPQTRNGKIDRAALPLPGPARDTYSAPRSEAEGILCGLFEELLHVRPVGVQESFFRLGGDSILSIQLVNRARRAGLEFSPRDVFERRTPKALAALAQPVANVLTSREEVSTFEATPIMRWMLERAGDLKTYSQSMTIEVPDGATASSILQAVQTLVDTHDMLRVRMDDEGRLHVGPRGSVSAGNLLYSCEDPTQEQAAVEQAASRLDPFAGPVMQVVWLTARAPQLLWVVIHHIAVDGVSWRILLHDMESAWNGQVLEPVRTSFGQWAIHLAAHASADAIESELPYWEHLLGNGGELFANRQLNSRTDNYATAGHFQQVLEPELSEAILLKVTEAFHAGTDDVLLWAFAEAAGSPLLVDMERHGREALEDGLDVSRTIGWFTTAFPVRLHGRLPEVKEQLRAVPHGGTGYGLLRYLNPRTAKRLAQFPAPQVGFNYLGRFDQSGSGAATGFAVEPNSGIGLGHLVDINVITLETSAGPVLSATWTWAGRQVQRDEIILLANAWEQALRSIAATVREGKGGHSPSDFPLVTLTQDEVERIEAEVPDLEDVLPLAPLQEGLLFHALFESSPGHDRYRVQFGLEFEGAVDELRMRKAVESLIERHAILRAVFRHAGLARPLQIVRKATASELQVTQLDGELDDFLVASRTREMSVADGPLFRAQLIKISAGRNLVLFTTHHLLFDGWSTATLLSELLTLYKTNGDLGSLPHVEPYARYLAWLGKQDHQLSLEKWREYLDDLETPTRLSTSALASTETVREQRRLTASLSERLRNLARERGWTLSVILQGLWAIALGKFAQTQDVVFGLTVSGRPGELAGVERMVGLFANTIPTRVRLHPQESLESFFYNLQSSQATLLAHHSVSLAEIQKHSGHEELFDTLFVFENYAVDWPSSAGHDGELRIVGSVGHGVTHYPLTLVVLPGDEILLRADVDPVRVSPARASALLDAFEVLAIEATANPAVELHRLQALETCKRDEFLEQHRQGVLEPLRAESMASLFENHAAATPDADAVVLGETRLSYAELNERANAMAWQLLREGLGPDHFVGVAIERSAEMIVALIAIVKTGACYVPLDVDPASARRLQILGDIGLQRIVVREDVDLLAREATNPNVSVHPQNAAYVNYTSGSTGKPKGVVVPQRAVVRLVCGGDFQWLKACRMLHLAPLSFDASTLEIWGPLLNGGCAVVAPPEVFAPSEIGALLRRCGVDTVWLSAGLFEQMVERALSDLADISRVLAGGDVLSSEHVQRLQREYPQCIVINGYGPTENTTFTTIYAVPSDGESPIPIGRPIEYTSVFLLDAWMNPLPAGANGELYTGGEGLARGYLAQPGQTAERFVANPFDPGKRLYRTGDLARWRDDGTLEFIGRVDSQCKLRGFRVELGEIEAALRMLLSVEQAAVIVRGEGSAKHLAAYFTPSASATFDEEDARRALGERLPPYMVPDVFVPLLHMPLTANGKLDRRALPAPERRGVYRAPRSVNEAILCELFAEVLGLESVDVGDDFFRLGGQSLLAMRLAGRISAALGIPVPIRSIFEARSPERLTACLPNTRRVQESLRVQERPALLPLSYAQQRLWFLHRMDVGQGSYNIVLSLRLHGVLDAQALEHALDDVMERHESLRTTFVDVEGVPYQRVLSVEESRGRLVYQHIEPDVLEAALAEAANYEFDLAQEPPVRAWVFDLGPATRVLLLAVHHIAADGSSLGPLARELSAFYAQRRRGETPAWAPLPVQYVDYTLWQRRALGDETDPDSVISRQLEFWRSALRDSPVELALPFDRPRPAVLTYKGSSVPLCLDAATHRQLISLTRATGASLFMLLQAALAVLLSRLGAGDDIPIGSPVAGRSDAALEGLIGFFVNTVVLRTDLSGDPSFREIVERARQFALEAYDRSDVPFERVVEALEPDRSLTRHPLFQVMLVLQQTFSGGLVMDGLTVEPEPMRRDVAKFDLTISLSEGHNADGSERGLYGDLEFSHDVFSEATALLLARRFERVLAQVAADPDLPMHAIAVLQPSERHEVVETFNIASQRPPVHSIVEIFEQQARQFPDIIALEYDNLRLTYRELNRRSNGLAWKLIEAGISRGDIVAAPFERGVPMVIAVLAILKAGGAYLPLDPSYPKQRIEDMLRNSEAKSFDLTCEDLSDRDPGLKTHPHDLAYVMYTSGSTGAPKGILIPHGAVVRLVCDCEYVDFAAGDRVAHLANVSFDPSTLEIWGALLNGGTLVILSRETVLVPSSFSAALRQARIDVMTMPASLFHQTVREDPACFSGVRNLLMGGEPLDPAACQLALTYGPPVYLQNGYGPTENTTLSTCYTVRQIDGESIPIGQPTGNSTVYVLDAWLEPVPVGVPGELYVGGAGLGWGYLRQPGRTAERFVANPFVPGARMYRTGDRVKWLRNGALDFIGRVDAQVKIRGFRIEPGEVAAALRLLPGVEQAFVLVHESATGKQLVGYVKPNIDISIEGSSLLETLRERLPEYMVPSAVVTIKEIPLTPNGKMDLAALPLPEIRGRTSRRPRTPQEEILRGIFADVLKLADVCVEDNFFRLGGHSLLATQVVSRVRRVLGVELPIRMLFETPTAAGLAERLHMQDTARPALVRQPRCERIPLSFAQQRLWFLDRMEGASGTYNIPLALRIEGRFDDASLQGAISDVIARHESLRTIFPEHAGEPYQQILTPESVRFWTVEEISEEELPSRLTEEVHRPFVLDREAPFRIFVFHISSEASVVLMLLHHIAGDGWSMGPLLGDVVEAWGSRLRGGGGGLGELRVQYADYTMWQRDLLRDGLMDRGLSFWREALGGLEGSEELAGDRRRSGGASFEGGTVGFRLSAAVHAGLRAVGESSGASLFMVLQAGLAAVLARLGAGEDIALGTPVAGRGEQALEELVGFFVNTLVLRTDVSGDPSFRELVERVRVFDLEAYGHAEVPFERVVEALAPERSLSRHPLFQVMFSLSPAERGEWEVGGLRLRGEPLRMGVAKFDLTFGMWELPGSGGVYGSVEYAADVYDRATAERLAGWYVHLLESAAAQPEARLHELRLMDAGEAASLVAQPAGQRCAAGLWDLFAGQVRLSPAAVAMEWQGGAVSYGELEWRARRIALRLRTGGLRRGELVALEGERGVDLVAAMLGVVLAGGAYLPLDPSYPAARRQAMLADSGARLLESWWAEAEPPEEEAAALEPWSGGSDLAYVMYTSGSTGRPKAIAVPQAAVERLVRETDYVCLRPGDRVAQAANVSFDAATFEIWGALLNGATLVLLERDTTLDPEALGRSLSERRIDTLFLTTALFGQVAREAPWSFAGLRDLLFGGEAVEATAVRAVLEAGAPRRLLHVYGPTENTTFSTWHRVEGVEGEAVPIGHAVGASSAYVLDDWLELVPPGAVGELYVGGAGLAWGYLGQAGRTAERFVASAWGEGERLYRTGDRVRLHPGGAIEFVGRADGQLKLRGFRIEPGEIEAALLSLAGVQQAAVVLDSSTGSPQLVAYVAALDPDNTHPAGLRRHLAASLPEYMVPELYLVLDRLPLTPNGKLDRRALQAPQTTQQQQPSRPLLPAELTIAELFQQLLHLKTTPHPQDNFFRLGGHSLLATRLLSRIRSTFGVDIPIRALFETPTVEELTLRVQEASAVRKPLLRSARPELLPLSFAQQRLWFLDQLGEGSCEYNMPEALRLQGRLDRAALEKTVQTIVDRHESLRTRFDQRDGEPVQVIEADLRIETPFEDLSELPEQEQQVALARALRDEWQTPFDLRKGPVFRARLLKLGDDHHVFLRTCHHVVSDGWSVGVFNAEFESLYAVFSEGGENPLPPLEVQYADFALWQREQLEGESFIRTLAYWRNQLAELPARLDLPMDRPRPTQPSYGAASVVMSLSAVQTEALKKLGRRHNATLYMTLLAGIAEIFARYSGQTDIVLGSPIANRQESQLELLIGFFVNTLVMRVKPDSLKSFSELLEQVRATTLGAYQHQDMPFERLVEELSPERIANASPLFQVMFAMQNAPMGERTLKGLEISPLATDELRVRFDLEIHGFERSDGLDVVWVYNRSLFDEWRVRQMSAHYVHLLDQVAMFPDIPLQKVPLLLAEEQHHLLREFGGQDAVVDGQSIKQTFEEQVRRTPHKVAVIFGGVELSYAALNRQANKMAHQLLSCGAGPETTVGISLDRSLEMVIALVAIVKAGCVYVPLDTSLPRQRLERMMEDANVQFVFGWETHRPQFAHLPHVFVPGDEAHQPDINPDVCLYPDNAVYVNYTSGSTGIPKGVLVTHGAVLRLVCEPYYVHLAEETVMLQYAPLSFDAATFEVWGALLSGGALVLVQPGIASADELGEMIARHAVNTMWLTAGLFQQMVNEALPSLQGVRQLLAGGDVLSTVDVRQLMETHAGCQVINGYGPTENTTFSCCYRIPRGLPLEGAIPIGVPIRGTYAYVLDRNLQPVPIGVQGELYVGGSGLARQYLGRPAETAATFVANPFLPTPGARMYRTGDRVSWRPDGLLEFNGRTDHQAKIRGFRIEPGEVESVLKSHPGVKDCIVAVHGDGEQKRMDAYFLAQRREEAREDIEREHIERWHELYESTYGSDSEQNPSFDITGWNSSYTSQPIPAGEMLIWREETVRQLSELQPERVLEVGCGTGLLLTQLAPSCRRYIGLDFSESVLHKLSAHLHSDERFEHVKLRQGLAHELGFLEDASMDLVVLNSIVQYFPDIEYLCRVLEEALRVVSPEGHIFVGDVRSFALLDAYHTSVQLHRSRERDSVATLRQRVWQAREREEELTVDAAFFESFAVRSEKCGKVETRLKPGVYDNELSRFRYDVLMHMGGFARLAQPEFRIAWDASGHWRAALGNSLAQPSKEPIALTGIPDVRVTSAVESVRLLQDRSLSLTNLEALRAACSREGQDVHELVTLARATGVGLVWSGFDRDGIYDAIFHPAWKETPRERTAVSFTRYANVPFRFTKDVDLIGDVQQFLQDRLPKYMLPANMTQLSAWPLTVNGKIDRAALAYVSDQSRLEIFQPPRTPHEEVLCTLFAEVLKVARVGIDDNFFDLGGHSLLAMRLVSRIGAALNAPATIQMVFEAPCVRALAERLNVGTSPETAFARVLPLRPNGSLPPLICIHPGGGLSWCYAALLREIDRQRPIYGIQASGISRDEPVPTSIKDMAIGYVDAIRTFQAHGPYLLVGASFGGLVAHAVACELQKQGDEVALLGMLDSYPPEGMATDVDAGDSVLHGYIAHYMGFDAAKLDDPSVEPSTVIDAPAPGAPAIGAEHAHRMIEVWKHHFRLCATFEGDIFYGDVLHVVAEREQHILRPESWQPYMRGHLHRRSVDCTHNDIVQPQSMAAIGKILEAYLTGENV